MRVKLLGTNNAAPKPAAPTSISVAMMVGNDREFIDAAIESAWTIADEVTVLDTGCTDGTADRAAELGAKVTRERFRTKDLGDGIVCIDDFGSARTRSLELASCEWTVLLDADERIQAPRLRMLLERMPECVDVVTMIHVHVDVGTAQRMPQCYRTASKPRYEHRLHETADRWLHAKPRVVAELPQEAAMVLHLGANLDMRAEKRRNERNAKLLALMLADDPNDTHALGYRAKTVTDLMDTHFR